MGINGSKVIGQIDHLMDVQHFEDAIFLTEQALKILDESFGHNFVEKTHNVLPNPMYYEAMNAHKNQNIECKQKQKQQTKTSEPQQQVNVNYNININFNINVNGNHYFNNNNDNGNPQPTAPSITRSNAANNQFNDLLNQF